jgi:hypothetical protein
MNYSLCSPRKNSRVLEANECVSGNKIFHLGCQTNMREFLRIYYRFYQEKLGESARLFCYFLFFTFLKEAETFLSVSLSEFQRYT